MILLHGINDNITFTHPYYLGVYQDETKKWDLYKEINNFWGEKEPKTYEAVVQASPLKYW